MAKRRRAAPSLGQRPRVSLIRSLIQVRSQSSAPVEAGGMFRALIGELGAAELTEVLRFTREWERGASVRLHAGDFSAVAAYDRRGRIRGGDRESAYDRAAGAWLANHLHGKDAVLLAGSNEEAAELARRVQAQLAKMGTVVHPRAPLADGNRAGTGDLIRARLNTAIDAGGQKLTNRDVLRIDGWQGLDAEVRRRLPGGGWSAAFLVPRPYLEASAELQYAGNIHVAQGRTADTAHLLVTDTLYRQSFYVGMSRGRESNIAHVVTGETAPEGKQPYEQAPPKQLSTGSWNGTAKNFPLPSRSGKARNGRLGPGTCSTCGPLPSGKSLARLLTCNSGRYLPRQSMPGTRKSISVRHCLRQSGNGCSQERISTRSSGESPCPRWTGPGRCPRCCTAGSGKRPALIPRCPGQPGLPSPPARSPGQPQTRWIRAQRPWGSGSSPSPSRGSCGTSDHRPGSPSPACRRC